MNRRTLIIIVLLATILLPLIIRAMTTENKPIRAHKSEKCPASLRTCRANIKKVVSASWGSGDWDYVVTNVRFYVSGSPAIKYSFSGYVKACVSGKCETRTISKSGSATSGDVWDVGVGIDGSTPMVGSAYMKGWCEAYVPSGMSTDLLIAGIGFYGNVGVTNYDDGNDGGSPPPPPPPSETKLEVRSNVEGEHFDNYVDVCYPRSVRNGRIIYDCDTDIKPPRTVSTTVNPGELNLTSLRFSATADSQISREETSSDTWSTKNSLPPPLTKPWVSSERYSGLYRIRVRGNIAYWIGGYSTGYLRVYAYKDGVKRLLGEVSKSYSSYYFGSHTISLRISNVTLADEYIRIETEGFGASGTIWVTEIIRKYFSYWEVFNDTGNVINITKSRTVDVYVPYGKTYTVKAYYDSNPPIYVEVLSRPISGIVILINGSGEITPFVKSYALKHAIIRLVAPDSYTNGTDEFIFKNWTVSVNGTVILFSPSRIINLQTGKGNYYTAVANYREANEPPPRPRINLTDSWVFYLPGESIREPIFNSSWGMAGVWNITVLPVLNSSEPLVALLRDPFTGERRYVAFTRIDILNPYNWSDIEGNLTASGKDVIRITSENVKYLPQVIGVNGTRSYNGWSYLGLVAWDPLKSSYNDGFLDNGTTLSVYNLTFVWRGKNLSLVFFRPVIVSTLALEIRGLYNRTGVNVVWSARYKYLPPAWLAKAWGISDEPPHQDLAFTLERDGSIVFRALKCEGFYGGQFGDELRSSIFLRYYDVYRDVLQGNATDFVARVRWLGPHGVDGVIYRSESPEVPFIPLSLYLKEIKRNPLSMRLSLILWQSGTRGVELENGATLSQLWDGEVNVDVEISDNSGIAPGRIYEDVAVYSGGFYLINIDINAEGKAITVYPVPHETRNLVLIALKTRY